MKRILIDLTSLNDNFSGIERYALEVTKGLLELDKENKYILLFKNDVFPFFKENKFENCEYHITEGGKLWVNQFGRNKAINKINPDVVYLPAFPPSLLMQKKKNRRIITMVHDLVGWDCPKTMKFKSKLLFKTGIKHGIKISNDITVNSYFTRRRCIEQFKIKDAVVVPCAAPFYDLSIDLFDEAKAKYNLPSNYFLSLGTLEPRKNFEGLLEMYSHLYNINNSIPNLVIVGRMGWKMEDLISKFSQIKDRIIFTGFVDDKYLSTIYSHANAFLFASIYEGFGIPVLEAIRNNVIPIASKIDSNFELLGENYKYLFGLNNEEFKNVVLDFLNATEEQKNKILNELKERTNKYIWINSSKTLLDLINK